MISAAGHAGDQRASRPRRPRSTGRRRRPSARSATTSAMPITTASLANSDGWIDMPAEQDPRPRAVDRRPDGQHQHQPADRGEVDQRRQDPHPAVVGGQHHHHQHQADGDVDQLLAEVRRGVAAGEVVAGRRGRPDQQAAEHQQRERRRPAAASRARARAARSPGGAGRSVRPSVAPPGRRQDRAVVARTSAARRAATVPGIAARVGVDVHRRRCRRAPPRSCGSPGRTCRSRCRPG